VQFFLEPEIQNHLKNQTQLFDEIMSYQGQVYRELENRRTQRIKMGEQYYFIKQHFGVGWKEIFKNLLQLRLPVISAKNEWQAIDALRRLNVSVPEVVGYGSRGWNPANRQSFIITRELPPTVTLEDFTVANKGELFSIKMRFIPEIARIARTLHENNINHRDFYLCHFLLDLLKYAKQTIIFYLIDLHRAGMGSRMRDRWKIKDLAGLYFSSKTKGLNERDLLRFIKYYRGKPLRDILTMEKTFWHKVKKRGDKLYQKHG